MTQPFRLFLAFCLICAASATPAAASETTPARMLFGKIEKGSAAPAGVIGSYAKGCLDGGVRLADVGPGYQTMRPSRNRAWGHPLLLKYLKDLASNLVNDGHAPMLVGDMAQPRGGPMLTGHRSHQSGLDADIWFRPSPEYRLTRKEREGWSAYSVVSSVKKPWVNDKFTQREARLIELAARDRRVARVFVSASIKKALCEALPEAERAWLRKVRPWWGHRDHLHVRLNCPLGSTSCTAQKPPPAGDGCGKELTSWLKPPKPKKPVTKTKKPKKKRKRKEIMLAQLPKACVGVLGATARQ